MKDNKKSYRWLIELTLIVIVIFAFRYWQQRDLATGVAPNIQAVTLTGQSIDLYKNINKPVLVHFWATWCPVCKLEQSSIENVSRDYPVLTVAMQSGTPDEVKSYMLAEKLSYNVVNDELGMLSRKYNIKGVPVSFIINKDNRIEFTEVGYTTEIGLRFRLWWAGL